MSFIYSPSLEKIKIIEWHVSIGDSINQGTQLLTYSNVMDKNNKQLKLRSNEVGKIKKIFVTEVGEVIDVKQILMELEGCSHDVVIKDMCAECGKDLQLLEQPQRHAQVSMIPNVPELKISREEAEELGLQDKKRLHRQRKLVLLVDLDQTMLHTTQNPAHAKHCKNNEEFFTFQLQRHEPTLFTKLRPGCREFLAEMTHYFEMQIVTFGSRLYAHRIASFLDPDQKLFAERILSRDECFHPQRKSSNLKHLFPCGPSMVCMIDDRDDVWGSSSNLVQVKKYSFFPGSGDINSPEKLVKSKTEDEEEVETDIRKRKRKASTEEDLNDSLNKLPKYEDPTKVTQESTNAVSNNPEETPDDPEVTSDVPEITPDIPEVTSDVPKATSDVPEVTSDVPEVTSDALEVTLDVPKATSDVPEATSDVPEVTSDVPEVTSDVQEVTSDVPEVTSDDIDETTDNNSQLEVSDQSSVDEDFLSSSTAADEAADLDKQASKGSNVDQEIVDRDVYLISLKEILLSVHQTYYEAFDKFIDKKFAIPPNTCEIIPFIRSKVLYGCRIVMTGIIPHNFYQPYSKHRSYVIAKQLGAKIDKDISEDTTHLICGKKGTVKYQNAIKIGNKKIHFVSIKWLWACSERWKKLDESDFPVPLFKSHNSTLKKPAAIENSDKLIKKVKDPRFEFRVHEALVRIQHNKLINPLYSSLKHPSAVVPISTNNLLPPPTITTTTSSDDNRPRERKASMAEMIPIDVMFSESVIADMKAEVDDLESSSSDENEKKMREKEYPTNSFNLNSFEPGSSSGDDSSIDEFDEMMADRIGRELEYMDEDD